MPPRSTLLAVFLGFFAVSLQAQRTTICVLTTTDLHGHIYPVDYFTGREVNEGVAKIATLIKQERQTNPDCLLIDTGDTIQGTSLEYVYQTYVRTGKLPLALKMPKPALKADPMMAVMNALNYTALAVGNHEYNFGLKNVAKARKDAKFPWISANTTVGPGAAIEKFDPYIVKEVNGIKVAIIGLTTPAVPSWEKPENIRSIRFTDAVQATADAMAELKPQKPDLVMVAAHMGLGRDMRSGKPFANDTPGENTVWNIAEKVAGIDAIAYGHTHQEVETFKVGDVLLMQPKNWGGSLGKFEFTFEKSGGSWKLINKTSKLLKVTKDTVADPEILAIARPYHELAEQYLNTPVAEVSTALDSRLGRIEDSALVDAVHQVQLHYTGADVSLTALFNPRVSVAKGPVTVRQIAALYLYENSLYAIEGNGQMLKDALENAATFFNQCADAACSGPLIRTDLPGYNFDMAQGVTYEIDLSRAPGDRIRNLRWKGEPLAMDQKLKIALNDYRAAGSAGYGMFKGAKVLWRSGDDIRQLMIDYYSKQGKLPAEPDRNWQIMPDAALSTLKREANAPDQRR